MKLVILASGRGSRLKRLTKLNPKCLLKINNKAVIDYQKKIFNYFSDIIIVVGYQKNKVMKNFNSDIKFIENKDYLNTNMVHSLFCPSKLITEDIIFTYSDIIFDSKVILKLMKSNKKNSILPLNFNWLNNWKKRMEIKKIYQDAEDIKMKNNKIMSIGKKIKNGKLPKMQYMGIMKIKHNDYHKMNKFYINLRNKNIDFTSFINLILKKNIINISYTKNYSFWTEIDSSKDYIVAKKLLSKKNLN